MFLFLPPVLYLTFKVFTGSSGAAVSEVDAIKVGEQKAGVDSILDWTA